LDSIGGLPMKKGTLIFLLICFALIAASCSASQNNVVNSGVAENRQAAPKSTTNSSDSLNYEIIKQTYTDRKITINYPQVTKMSNSKKQDILNAVIKSEAFHVLSWFSDSELDNFSMNLDYEVKWQSSELLSIKYSGVRYLKGAAYPTNVFFTTNLNMYEGSRVKLKDLVNIDENFVEKVKRGKFSRETSREMFKFTNDKLIESFSTADSIGDSSTFSYFTNDSLGIKVSVIHALGDHVEFEVKYQDIADNIKAENEVWKNFFK
jgi:hypothetical protein